MIKVRLFLFAALVLSLCTGCASVTCIPSNFEEIISKLNLKKTFDDIAFEMCGDACIRGDGSGKVCADNVMLVTDFQDIRSQQSPRYGVVMGDIMKSGLSNICGYKLIQSDFSKYFLLTESGSVSLRKDSHITGLDTTQFESVVGTYDYSENGLYLFVRKINIHTGQISKSVTREIAFSCVGDVFFSTVK